MMRAKTFWLSVTVGVALNLTLAPSSSWSLSPEGVLALVGRVSSTEEGPMEGVLVSAKKTGSTVSVSVVSDSRGQYSFPRNKLAPGEYSLRIRAVEYEMDDPGAVGITPDKTL